MEKELDGNELERIYKESDQVDKDTFAKMRSNVLLVVGQHYTKKASKFFDRLRDTKDLSENQKLRLTKNHIQTITRTYVGNILSHAANTKIFPNNPGEIQDKKTAEMNQSALTYFKKRLNLRAKTRESAEDFVHFGEVYTKVFFDPDMGDIKGYEQAIDELGQPVFDPMGQPVADETKPVMEGTIVVERVLAFNLLRDPGVQNIEDSPYLIVRKMVHKTRAKRLVPPEHPLLKDIENGTGEESYLIFDGDKATYEKTKDYVMLREHYYRPCKEYPKGQYFFCIRGHILVSGELPFGIFPILGAGFDKVPTSARYNSPIDQMKPYQIEINRCASAIAQHQITLGDDKLILPNGAKLTQSAQLPGIRALTVNGGMGSPTVMEGRSGEQYLGYMQSQIKELYEIMNVSDSDSMRDGQLDPYALLYYSIRNRQKFAKYAEVFEEFIIARDELILETARRYMDDNAIIPIVGKSDIINMAEFKHNEPSKYRIRVEAVSDDTETMFGKQLALNHTMQYVGSQFTKEDIGRMLRASPFLDNEEAFGDFTIDYDNAVNDILALERGEMPFVNPYGSPSYTVERLVHRMKQPDYKLLNPQIQQMFEEYKNQLLQVEADRQAKIKAMNADFIPTGGYLVTADFYIAQGNGETKRAKIPYEAMAWLLDRLEKQGQSQAQLEAMNQGALAQMAQMGATNNQVPPTNGMPISREQMAMLQRGVLQ